MVDKQKLAEATSQLRKALRELAIWGPVGCLGIFLGLFLVLTALPALFGVAAIGWFWHALP